MATVQLLARCDDAGGCESANKAIYECCTRGVARNVSLMANGAAIAQAAEMLKDLKHAAFGCHLTLNAEWERVRWGPVLPADKVPSLVEPDGTLTRTPMVLHERQANVEEMVVEAQAQLDLLRKLGFNISYIDEHMGVGWQNGLRDRLLRLAEREGLIHGDTIKYGPLAPSGPANDPVEKLIHSLKNSAAGVLKFVTHPGLDAPDMHLMGEPDGRVAKERDRDRQILTDPRLVAFCRGPVEPVRYTDVARPSTLESAETQRHGDAEKK